MARPTQALLSNESLKHNVAWIQKRIGHSKIIAMVKANAYGHGIRSISQHIASDVAMLGVASVDEAMMIRNIGLNTDIMLAEGVFEPEEWGVASAYHCQVVIHHATQIQWLYTLEPHQKVRIWLKVNTGMNRLGFHPRDIPELYALLRNNPRIQSPMGILSHFASSELADDPKTAQQASLFRSMIASLPDFSGPVSLCNSGGILNRSQDFYDYVRPGLLLYGVCPSSHTTGQELGLRPVMTLQSKLISVYTAPGNDMVGYNGQYQCPEDMPVGVVAIGYGDGYPFTARNGTPMRVNNVVCPLIGRVSMDMIAVDLRPCPWAKVGDEVTLWGQDLPVESIVPFTQESCYTLLTGLQNRVRCHWIENEPALHQR